MGSATSYFALHPPRGSGVAYANQSTSQFPGTTHRIGAGVEAGAVRLSPEESARAGGSAGRRRERARWQVRVRQREAVRLPGPASESSRAYERLRDATGERPMPEVELLVEPASGNPRAAAERAGTELRTVSGVRRVLTPAADRRLLSDDGRAALVLGFLSAQSDDISEVGTRVRDRFSGRSRREGRRGGGHSRRADDDDAGRPPADRALRPPPAPAALPARLQRPRRRASARHQSAVLSILTTLLLLNGSHPGDRHRHVRDQHRHRPRPRPRDRLQPLPRHSIQGGARDRRARSRRPWRRPRPRSAA